MNAAAVIELDQALRAAGITLWIDGGWGVDALLGWQTRPHADLDIVVQTHDMAAVRRFLAGRGYQDVPRDDTHDWNFVLGDAAGRQVDVHVIWFDHTGAGIYGPIGDGLQYPAGCLNGRGTIAGYAVPCITPEVQVRFHTGYAFDADDIHDVLALCEQFGLPVPPEYQEATADRSATPAGGVGARR